MLCPFCFQEFRINEIQWRCLNLSCTSKDDKIPGELDYILDNYLKEMNQKEGDVKRNGHAFNASGARQGESAACDWCRVYSQNRICPKCHNNLPRRVDDMANYHLAVVGAPRVGKSHYLASLIKLFQKDGLGQNFNVNLMDANDATTARFKKEFYAPIFEFGRILEKSQQFDRAPLMYRLKKQNNGARKLFSKFRNSEMLLVFYDNAGENFDNEDVLGLYARYVRYSSAIILLVDPLQMPSLRNKLDPALFPNMPELVPTSEPSHIVNRIIRQYEAFGKLKAGKKIDTPIAVVFTKSDVLKDAEILPAGNAIYSGAHHQGNYNTEIAKTIHDEVQALIAGWHGGELDNLLSNYFRTYNYFAMSALGQAPDSQGNLTSVSPFRVEDPFLWALTQMNFL